MIEKKSALICILKILEEYTDEEHYLTQTEISELIEKIYDFRLERKSISTYISILEDLEFDIVRDKKKGVALFSRALDASEIRFINDAIFSSKSITGKQAQKISEKLNKLLSKYQRKNYNYIHKSTEISRSSNEDIFFNIEEIEEAIKKNLKISFQYLTYDNDGKRCFRKNGYRYRVSPYYMVNNFGKYYLICNYNPKYHPIQIFRIDYMENIQIEEETPLLPLKTLEGMDKFNISEYLNEHIYLFSNDVIEAIIEISKPDFITQIEEWFGKKAKIYKKDDKLCARIKCDEGSLLYWLLQYGSEITLISPSSLIDKLKEHLINQIEKYK